MNIIQRHAWGARHPDGHGSAPLPARELFLHHAVTRPPADDPAEERRAMRQLEDIGQDRFGRGISYTFAVAPSGRVYEGHSVDRLGAHTKGRNSTARGIVLLGDYSTRAVPAKAVQAVADLVAYGNDRDWWTVRALTGGHRDVGETACPGDAGYAAIRWINAAVGRPAPTPVPPTPAPVEDDMLIATADSGTAYLITNGLRFQIVSLVDKRNLVAAGAKEVQLSDKQISIFPDGTKR